MRLSSRAKTCISFSLFYSVYIRLFGDKRFLNAGVRGQKMSRWERPRSALDSLGGSWMGAMIRKDLISCVWLWAVELCEDNNDSHANYRQLYQRKSSRVHKPRKREKVTRFIRSLFLDSEHGGRTFPWEVRSFSPNYMQICSRRQISKSSRYIMSYYLYITARKA